MKEIILVMMCINWWAEWLMVTKKCQFDSVSSIVSEHFDMLKKEMIYKLYVECCLWWKEHVYFDKNILAIHYLDDQLNRIIKIC
jgi:hypothetical protein